MISSSHANYHSQAVLSDEYKDNMVPCQEHNCSDYFYQLDGNKYRYCPSCRRKDMC